MGTSVERASAEPELYQRAAALPDARRARRRRRPRRGRSRPPRRLLERARDERAPAVLEALTYRYRGHSVADAGLAYRTEDEIAEHRDHDPIVRAARAARARRRPTELDELREQAEGPRGRGGRRSPRTATSRDVGELAARHVRDPAARRSSSACARSAVRRGELVFAGGLGRRRRRTARATTGVETMTYREALRLALREEMARDERVFVMGEEVGVFDGAYKVTAGLMERVRPERGARHADLRGGLRRRRRSAPRCSASVRSSRS